MQSAKSPDTHRQGANGGGSMSNPDNQRQHVVIIGAGVGGAALAARLAHRGYRVTVVEKHGEVGGRCSLLRSERHRWDVGPSLYLMPELFESFFASLGLDINDYIKLERCEPSYKVHFAPEKQGTTAHSTRPAPPLELSTSLASLGPQLDRYEKRAGNPHGLQSFLSFIKEAGEHYEESVKHVLLRDWNSLWRALARWDVYPMLLKTQALRIYSTAWKRACYYFRSDEIRRAMTFSAMYMGMSPFEAPATYTLLQYAEYAKGVFYPIGGFQTLVAAFEKVARDEFGATFRFNTTVTKILTDEQDKSRDSDTKAGLINRAGKIGSARVYGVELEDGSRIHADAVISNADLVWTYNKLLPPSNYAQRLQHKHQTCSSISFYWGLSETVDELGIHNIFLAEKYRESFDQIFEDGIVPSEPSFYVNVPSRIDPSAAPHGGETLVILVPCGPIASKDAPQGYQDKDTFAKIKATVRQQVLDTLHARTGRDLAPLIREEQVMDPWDWRDKFGLWDGSILGLSHCISQVLWFRPSNQHATLKNMFFVGASAMPGTGVPVVCAGSGIVADKVDRFLRSQRLRAGKRSGSFAESLFIASVFAIVLAILVFFARTHH